MNTATYRFVRADTRPGAMPPVHLCFSSVEISDGGDFMGARHIRLPPRIALADVERMAGNSFIPYCADTLKPSCNGLANMLVYTTCTQIRGQEGLHFPRFAQQYLANTIMCIQHAVSFPVAHGVLQDSIGAKNASTTKPRGGRAQKIFSMLEIVRHKIVGDSGTVTAEDAVRPTKRKRGKHVVCDECSKPATHTMGTFRWCVDCHLLHQTPLKRARLRGHTSLAACRTQPGQAAPHRHFIDCVLNTSRELMRGYMFAAASDSVSNIQTAGAMVCTNPISLLSIERCLSMTNHEISAMAAPDSVVVSGVLLVIAAKKVHMRRAAKVYMPFKQAQQIVQQLGLKDADAYSHWARTSSERTVDIPIRPHEVYGDNWGGYAHFLHADAPYNSSAARSLPVKVGSYAGLFFNGVHASTITARLCNYGITIHAIKSGELTTVANVMRPYEPARVGWGVELTTLMFFLTYNHTRHIICARMASVVSAMRSGHLVITCVLDARTELDEDDVDPRLMPHPAVRAVGTQARPIRVGLAHYCTWGFLYGIMSKYVALNAHGVVHISLRGCIVAARKGACVARRWHTGACFAAIVDTDHRLNQCDSTTVAPKTRAGSRHNDMYDELSLTLVDDPPTVDASALSIDTFMGGACMSTRAKPVFAHFP